MPLFNVAVIFTSRFSLLFSVLQLCLLFVFLSLFSLFFVMSTQSPTPPTPKGPRNNRRQPKKTTSPYAQKPALLTTPPSSPPRNLSPGGTATDSSNNISTSKKKNPRSAKKTPRDVPKNTPFNNGHRHTSSSGTATTPQLKDSPHYAGPTFHASPAPSALPMPSFFSKSMPESDLAPTLESENEGFEGDPEIETTPSKPKSRPQHTAQEEQPTPLDFLFKAAVQARNAQAQRSPEAESAIRSPQTDSKALPRNPNNVAGGMFPLEMEGSESPGFQIGPSFAASYRDRMGALRSASSPSQPHAELNEGERKAKTEALKSLLLNPRPQRPSSSSPATNQTNQTSGVNVRPSASPNVSHFATPLRTTSGPPSTGSRGFSNEQNHLAFTNGYHSPLSYAQNGGPLPARNQPSPLRREVPTSSPSVTMGVPGETFSPAQMAYGQPNSTMRCAPPPRPQYGFPEPYPTVSPAMPAQTSPQSSDTKKMENDLRRILKLDASPGFSSNGVQSSFA